MNDGTGNFTEDISNSISAMSFGSTAFADIDGDGDFDLFMSRGNSSSPDFARIYENNGSGLFTPLPNATVVSAYNSSTNFEDVDGDGDPDLFVTGNPPGSIFGFSASLYLNDGNGGFTLLENPGLAGVREATSDFGDIDGDGDPDLIPTGVIGLAQRSSKLYENDGQGNFLEIEEARIASIKDGAVAFFDVNNDADLDLIISVADVSRLYVNDGAADFSEAYGSPFDRSVDRVFSVADIDNDNDLDVLFVGSSSQPGQYYINDGDASLTLVEDSLLANVVQVLRLFPI